MYNKKRNTLIKWIWSLTAIITMIHITMMWTEYIEIPPKLVITVWAFGFAVFPLVHVFSEDVKE